VGAHRAYIRPTPNYGEEALWLPDATTMILGLGQPLIFHFNDKNEFYSSVLDYDHRAINGDQNGIVGEEALYSRTN